MTGFGGFVRLYIAYSEYAEQNIIRKKNMS